MKSITLSELIEVLTAIPEHKRKAKIKSVDIYLAEEKEDIRVEFEDDYEYVTIEGC